MIRRLASAFIVGGLIGYGAAASYVYLGGAGMVLGGEFHHSAFMHKEFSVARGMSEAIAEGYSPHMASDGRNILGVEAGPTADALNQVAVVFHNHKQNALERIDLGNELRALGFHIYLAEYAPLLPGVDSSEHEELVLERAKVQFDYLAKRYKGYPVTFIGESIGAAVGAKAMVLHRLPVEHFVAVSPWTSIKDLAQQKSSAFALTAGIELEHELLPYLRAYQGHLSFVGTGNDPDIPESHVNQLNQELFGSRHDGVWWAEEANSSDWIHHFTLRQKLAMLVNFDHLVPLDGQNPAMRNLEEKVAEPEVTQAAPEEEVLEQEEPTLTSDADETLAEAP